jgi:Flp pilus assembly protein TadD
MTSHPRPQVSLSRALLACRRALALAPGDPGLHAALGGIYLQLGRFEEAQEACRRALAIDPAHGAALVNLASACQSLEDWDQAESLYLRILAQEPGSATARFNLARLLALTGREAEALPLLDAILSLDPSDGEAHLNRGFALARLGRLTEALAAYELAQACLPDPAEARWNHGILSLLQGDYGKGWAGYEARWSTAGFRPLAPAHPQPLWRGEPFPGRTLLLQAEQGLGDTLMFARFLPRVRALGGRVILEAPKPLLGVLGTCRGLDGVHPGGEPLPGFDLHLPLHSLGRLLCPTLAAIPGEIPYLAVPPEVPHRDALDARLAPSGDLRVGLAWTGNPGHAGNRRRSLPIDLLERLGDVPGIRWYSLQVPAQGLPALPGAADLGPLLADFSDSAHALANLDLLISVDTALVHLAGALGRPAWVLLPCYPDWRWLLERPDSPWYPSLRLYRQPKPGDWATVLARLAGDLERLRREPRPSAPARSHPEDR